MKRLAPTYILLTLALVACGGDAQQRPRAQGNLTAACQADIAFFQSSEAAEEAVGEPPQGEPPPEFVQKLAKSYERVLPVHARLEANAPSEVRPAVLRRGQAIRDLIRAPEFQKFDRLRSPEFQGILAFFYRECPGNKASVDGVDYAFRNLTDLRAGVTRLEFENTGKEEHELLFLTPKPGVTEPIEEILKEGPSPAVFAKVDGTFAGFAPPGETAYAIADLKAGEYLAVCFIPKGATGQGPPPDPEKSRPHSELGMQQTVTVG